ncbi:hypothetical protein H0H92_000038 [Tricholoma furcatifolium]|nr:hypothetical protein H0H92_000038 [Tricholoma furcatifolium]
MLPFSLGSALTSAVSGIIVSRTGQYRPVLWIAYAVFTIGLGLMTMLSATSADRAEKVIFLLISALGLGCLFQTPLIGLQAAMPIKDMATSTATFGFIRTLGGTVGISIGEAIFTSIVAKKLVKIPNLTFNTSPGALTESVRQLKDIPRTIVRQGDAKKPDASADVEKGATAEDDTEAPVETPATVEEDDNTVKERRSIDKEPLDEKDESAANTRPTTSSTVKEVEV